MGGRAYGNSSNCLGISTSDYNPLADYGGLFGESGPAISLDTMLPAKKENGQ